MLRRDRIVAMVTLSLLNVFTLGAGVAVVKLTPQSSLQLEPPSVATRAIVRASGSSVIPSDASAPMPGSGLGIELLGLLGGQAGAINAVVVDATTRRTLFDQRAKVAAVPASTTKVVTSAAALAVLGSEYRLTTKVVKGAGGGIVLVGGGDPTLTAGPPRGYPTYASLPDLAKRTAAALKAAGTTRVRVDYDASLYQGSRTAPGWKPNYMPDGEVAPVTALMVDEGRVAPGNRSRVADPPGAATQAFAGLLRQNGISARAGTRTQAAPKAAQLAAVQSPPVSVLVERLMTDSDNDLAEAMIRQVAIKRKRPPTFAGGAQAVQETLAQLGVGEGVRLADGSGLSTSNRITPMALARIISLAASGKRPELRAMITGLPVAGFSGTLADRYTTVALPGAGVVRAKTGTLANVSTLAGITSDADGRLLAFAFMAGSTNSEVLDQLASIVAMCGCR
ncbi:D-alanyl-D-alanine carboxypeptidase/D-alanyl-D-alanine-endopeptidase [Actinomadura sp. HBU206391]|uniref:D-alanyl-D-alanine carboxypeptidase/D-alanyl-D-alanine endopeptidase n=1 Tax=Actinomadura sp. HBU206391 TaxID=2731692 RepID=UPI0016502A56|nr:D-alanyl-D-alanine carboxypeptidase/D-alanyl-D-alanine-endopeptidase [Actinomadura sp. HBU206391]MBC6458869.1 D-alanyl-D-alanine carboxypeptidase/D-alanyl-D-alanine-endopeptidase [Actinomadura sp. HBU206391]